MTEKITTRLRKLIRLGESANEAEAQNALAQAAKLAAKYHLDLATIDASQDEGAQLGHRVSDVVLWGRRRRKYRWQLAHAVAQAWGCVPWTVARLVVKLSRMPSESEVLDAYKLQLSFDNPLSWALREKGEGAELVLTRPFGGLPEGDDGWRWSDRAIVTGSEYSATLAMIGRKDAAEAAVYSYHVLLGAVDSIAKRVASGRAGINSARWGLVHGLRQRLKAELAEDEVDDTPVFASKSTAMVLAGAREEAGRYLEDSYGCSYSKGRALEISDEASYLAGVGAADEIEIPDPSGGRAAVGSGIALPVGKDRQLA